MRRSLVFLLACAALGVGRRPAHAAPSAVNAIDAREQKRTALYQEGVELAEAEHWAEALTRFQTVVAIRSAPAALLALGTAEEKLGRLTAAKRIYTRAWDDAGALGDRALVKRAASKLDSVDTRIAHLVIRLSRAGTGAVASIDGARVELSGERIEIDPGEHRVVVALEGEQPYDQRLGFAEAENKDISVDLGPAAPEGNTRAFAPPLGPLILGGTGITAAAVGAIVWLNAKPVYDDATASLSACPKGNNDCANEWEGKGNAARDRIFAGSIVAGVGALAIAGAAVWWVLSPPAHGGEEHRPSGSVGVAAGPARGGYWVRLDAAF
jgi:hypothetical protein